MIRPIPTFANEKITAVQNYNFIVNIVYDGTRILHVSY